MLRRVVLLVLFLPVSFLVAGGIAYAAASGLPWWAVGFGALFWVLLSYRLGRRSGGAHLEPSEDGPLWSPFRSRGF